MNDVKEQDPHPKESACETSILIWSYLPIIAAQRAFEELGKYLSRHPARIAILVLLTIAISTLGLLRKHDVTLTKELFMTQSNAIKHAALAERLFVTDKYRKQEIIFRVLSPQQNLITTNCFNETLSVHKTVVRIPGYNDLCARTREDGRTCATLNPLDLIHYREGNFVNTSRVTTDSYPALFAGVNDRGLNLTATGMRIVYYLRAPKNESLRKRILSWESKFVEEMTQLQMSLSCVSMNVLSARSADDDLRDLLESNYTAAALGALLLLVVGAIVAKLLHSFSDFLCYLVWITFMTLSFVSAGCVAVGFDIPFLMIFLVFPFVMTGKLVGDSLIFLQGLSKENLSLCDRISNCLTSTGLTVHITAVVNAVACGFVIIFSTTSAVDYYHGFALIGIMLSYYFFIFAFVTTVAWLSKKTDGAFFKLRVCCKGQTGPSKKNTATKVIKRFTTFLDTKSAVIIVVFLLVGAIIFGTFYAQKAVLGTNLELYKSSKHQHFMKEKYETFGYKSNVDVIFQDSVDYGKKAVQEQIMKVLEAIRRAPYTVQSPTTWIESLNKYADTISQNCSDSNFYFCLEKFLAKPENTNFKEDISFEKSSKEQKKITATRIHVSIHVTGQISKDHQTISAMKKDISKVTNLRIFIESDLVASVENIIKFGGETISILVSLGFTVFCLVLIHTASPIKAVFVICGLSLQVLDLHALMCCFNVPLNMISFFGCFTTIMVAIGLSIQIVQSFALTSSSTVEDRLSETLCSTGTAVLVGALLSVLGSICLGFVFRNLNLLFINVLPLVLLFGLIHALLLLPASFLFLDKLKTLFRHNSIPKRRFVFSWKETNVESVSTYKAKRFRSTRKGVAVVGVACRFPQARNKDEFWSMLLNGVCAVGTFPENREKEYKELNQRYYPKRFVSGRICTMEGSFLEEIKLFDAGFFKMSPQEARATDPQQKIILEVVYEAIEDAGLNLEHLQKGKTGVFVGIMNLDFKDIGSDKTRLDSLDQVIEVIIPLCLVALIYDIFVIC